MFSLSVGESQALKIGIDVHRLKAGIMLLVLTRNTLYKITKRSDDQYAVTVEGGKFFKKPTHANFSGSTFGGSIMKIGWIGYGMCMEMYSLHHRKKYHTTPVEAARIIGPGWEYDMEWDEMNISTEPKIKV